MKIILDSRQATVLGFTAAGWTDLIKNLEGQGIKVYTTTNHILPQEDSIYYASHKPAVLEMKAKNNRINPQEVSLKLNIILDLLCSLQEPATRKAIIDHVLVAVLGIKENIDEIMQVIATDEKPSHKMLDFLIEKTAHFDPQEFDEYKKEIDLQGYTLVSCLREEQVLQKCLYGRDKIKLAELKQKIAFVDISTKSKDLQLSAASSKSIITDTLQCNLNLLKQGKPLVPIFFVISAELDCKNVFNPDWQTAIDKTDFGLTNVEIRMAYKLTKEIDDCLINKIMEKTVIFLHKSHNGFKRIPAPWLLHPEVWANRRRSGNKCSYKERAASVPQWVASFKSLSANVCALNSRYLHELNLAEQEEIVFSSIDERQKHIVLDDGAPNIAKASEEDYRAYLINNEMSLDVVLQNVVDQERKANPLIQSAPTKANRSHRLKALAVTEIVGSVVGITYAKTVTASGATMVFGINATLFIGACAFIGVVGLLLLLLAYTHEQQRAALHNFFFSRPPQSESKEQEQQISFRAI